jgi:thiol:disulfide interchange protein
MILRLPLPARGTERQRVAKRLARTKAGTIMKPLKRSFVGARLVLGVLPAGVVLLLSGCSRNVASAPDTVVASAPISENSTPEKPTPKKNAAPKATKISWEPSMDAALEKAKKSQKPIMIDFFATWCGPCKMLDEKIYPDAAVVEEAQNFVCVKVDVDKHTDIARKYNVSGLPSLVFLDASGTEIHRQAGIDGTVSSFVSLMQNARSYVAPTPA